MIARTIAEHRLVGRFIQAVCRDLQFLSLSDGLLRITLPVR